MFTGNFFYDFGVISVCLLSVAIIVATLAFVMKSIEQWDKLEREHEYRCESYEELRERIRKLEGFQRETEQSR